MTELGLNIPSLVAYLINFVVLLGILIVFAYKPLISAIDPVSYTHLTLPTIYSV